MVTRGKVNELFVYIQFLFTQKFTNLKKSNPRLVNILSPPITESTRGGFFFAHKTRMLIMVLSTACLSAIMANSLALNFTVICMVNEQGEFRGADLNKFGVNVEKVFKVVF